MDLILKALNKAYYLHNNHKRKGNGAPYFVHLLDTCKYLMYDTYDDEIICAGILHDTLEDTHYSDDELRSDFGERVYSLVKFCTEPLNNVNSSGADQKNSWFERKSGAIAKLNSASNDELLIFCADKVSTLLSIREDLVCGVDIWSKLNGSRKDVEWYYSEIFKVLQKKLHGTRIILLYEDLLSDLFKKIKK
jgi:(p)ppGpp synthase/HD superfamily hydrolase